jgi:hypothetical protein
VNKENTALQVKYADSKLISIIRWFSWIAASIISALINIWFVSQLASHFYEMLIFAVVALVLECGKLSAVLRANIFGALFKKVGGEGINRKRKSSYIVYSIYALFAIICATGFSVNMTTNVASNYDTQIATLELQKTNIQELQITIPVSEELIQARLSYNELQQQYLSINREDDDIQYAYRTKQLKEDGNITSWTDANASSQKLRSITRDRDEAQEVLNKLQSNYDEEESRRKVQLIEAEQKFGTIIDIDAQIGTLKVNQAMNAGSAQIFITLGNMFNFNPNTFRLIILIFLSILVEYIVFSLAPTSKVNRKLLYDYREFIPKEKVSEILQEFDKELELYLGNNYESELERLRRIPPQEISPRKKRIRKPKIENFIIQEPIKPEEVLKIPEIQEEIIPKDEIPEIITLEKEEVFTENKIPEIVIEQKEEEKIPIEKKSSDVKLEESNILKEVVNEKLIHYRLGKTTASIMKRLIDFINICIKNEGEFEIHPDIAASRLELGNRAKQVFINQLSSIRLGTKPLIVKNKYGEYYSNFSSKQIIDYISEIKDDQ